jgi:hypothetical protein
VEEEDRGPTHFRNPEPSHQAKIAYHLVLIFTRQHFFPLFPYDKIFFLEKSLKILKVIQPASRIPVPFQI